MRTKDGSRRRSPLRMAGVVGLRVRSLVRDVELATREVTEKVKRAGMGAVMFGVAGILGLAAIGSFTAAAIFGLSIVLPAWASALIVGGVWTLSAAVVAFTAKRSFAAATPPLPKVAAKAVKDDVRLLARELRRGR